MVREQTQLCWLARVEKYSDGGIPGTRLGLYGVHILLFRQGEAIITRTLVTSAPSHVASLPQVRQVGRRMHGQQVRCLGSGCVRDA